MEVLEKRIQSRRENHIFYQDLFNHFDDLNLFSEPSEKFYSNYWLNVILIDGLHWNKEKLRNIFSENNIETRYLWKPMHLQTLYKECFFLETIFLVLFLIKVCAFLREVILQKSVKRELPEHYIITEIKFVINSKIDEILL